MAMAFRDHPLMTRRSGMKSWPPLWTSTRKDKTDWPKDEVGMLREAWLHDGLDTCLFLFMEIQWTSLYRLNLFRRHRLLLRNRYGPKVKSGAINEGDR